MPIYNFGSTGGAGGGGVATTDPRLVNTIPNAIVPNSKIYTGSARPDYGIAQFKGSSTSFLQDYLYLIPVFAPKAATNYRIIVPLTPDPTNTGQLDTAVFLSDSTHLLPRTPVVDSVSGTVLGVNDTFTQSGTFTLDRGWYWVGLRGRSGWSGFLAGDPLPNLAYMLGVSRVSTGTRPVSLFAVYTGSWNNNLDLDASGRVLNYAGLGAAVESVEWSFATAAPSVAPTGTTVSVVSAGNTGGATTLITNTSPCTVVGSSAGNNAQARCVNNNLSFDPTVSTYFQFSITPPSAGVDVSLSAFSFNSRSTATGPGNYGVYRSVDNGSTFTLLGSAETLPKDSTWVARTQSGFSSPIPTTGAIYRIYGWSTGSSTGANWKIDDLKITISNTPTELVGGVPVYILSGTSPLAYLTIG